MFKLSEEYIREILQMIYNGTISKEKLPIDVYLQIADYLKDGIYKGYGIDFSSLTKQISKGVVGKFDATDLELLTELRSNIYMFSAAKTYQQVKEMSSLLIDENGTLRTYNEWVKDARQVFDTYNETWLKTEFDTSIGQAQNAVKWNNIQKQADVLPLLVYDAVIDKNTSDICRPLDGLVAPVNDPVWKKIMPLNHFNCRCMVKQLSAEEGKATAKGKKETAVNDALDKMQDVFKMNPGRDGYVFSPDHPYFTVPKSDKEFAKTNFGLKIPKKD